MLKIAITADPELPVPPGLYGGIERIIAMLIKNYTVSGHQVSLFAHAGSVTEAKLYPYPGKGNSITDSIKNSYLINRTLFASRPDIIHSFSRLAYLLPQLPIGVPKIMSYQREPTISQVKKAYRIAKKDTLYFTGCSDYISRKIAPFAPAYTIYNGVGPEKYQFKASVAPDAPLVFLGRIEPIKGTHIAIELAKKTAKKLVIAGNIPAGHQEYFDSMIKPHLSDDITYIGAVNDEQKNILLGQAAAFLMPIQWNEPFGIVMIEAMACGTPVIGFNKGAVSEVIENNIDGFYGDTVAELVGCINRIAGISRTTVWQKFEKRFSSEIIAANYLQLYQELINKTKLSTTLK